MDIRIAKKDNIDGLYNLWQECFGDSKEIIDMFFNSSFSLDNTVVCVDDNNVVAMAYMLEESIFINGIKYSAYYLYALATTQSYRKKGIMAQVIEYIIKLSVNRNIDYLFLVPASEKLFNYYKKFGFQNAFCQKKIVITREVLNFMKDNECLENINFDIDFYYDTRYKKLEKTSFVDWNKSELELAKNYFNSASGETILTSQGAFFVEHTKNCDKVYDLTISDIDKALSTIGNYVISDKIELYVSKNFPLISANQQYYDCGMVKKLKPNLEDLKDTFMGITLQ